MARNNLSADAAKTVESRFYDLEMENWTKKSPIF